MKANGFIAMLGWWLLGMISFAFAVGMIVLAHNAWTLNQDPKGFWTQCFAPSVIGIVILFLLIRAFADKGKSFRTPGAICTSCGFVGGILLFITYALTQSYLINKVVFDGSCTHLQAVDNSQNNGVQYTIECGGKSMKIYPRATLLNESMGNPLATFSCKAYAFNSSVAKCD